MKSHELARALSTLSQILRHGPNIELENLSIDGLSKTSPRNADVPLALSTLVALSKYDKSQWQNVIEVFEIPVVVRPRDASRDILGKILKHLEESPESRRRIASQAGKNTSDTSPELMRALELLLRK